MEFLLRLFDAFAREIDAILDGARGVVRDGGDLARESIDDAARVCAVGDEGVGGSC